nr:hypothetical protein [Exiguobacterium sp. SL14]
MHIRPVTEHDLPAILAIYNEGIEDRIATLETDQKDLSFMTQWFAERTERYAGYVAEDETGVLGFISLDPYNPRPVYATVGEISVYITGPIADKGLEHGCLKRLNNMPVIIRCIS